MNIFLSYSTCNVRQRGVSISNMSSGNLEVVIYIMILFCTNFLFDVKKTQQTNQVTYVLTYFYLQLRFNKSHLSSVASTRIWNILHAYITEQ